MTTATHDLADGPLLLSDSRASAGTGSGYVGELTPLPLTVNDSSIPARVANSYAFAHDMPTQDVYAFPRGNVYIAADSNIEWPVGVYGPSPDLSALIGDGNVSKITAGVGGIGSRTLQGFTIKNESAEGSLIRFDLQGDMRGLRLKNMRFGKSTRHLDGQSLNTTAVGGTMRDTLIEDCEFTEASYASRMFRHAIGYRERNCRTHHNQAGLWLSSGANALSIARASIHGEFSDQNRYHIYAGGDVGAGEINGITIETGTLLERAWLVAPPYGTRGGDIILETTTAKKVLGFRFKPGVVLGLPTAGQVERVSVSPNGGGYIGPIDLSDVVPQGTVPLWSFANISVLKVSRDKRPAKDQQTRITDNNWTDVFTFRDAFGDVLPMGVTGWVDINAVDESNGGNSVSLLYHIMTNADGITSGTLVHSNYVIRGVSPGYANNPCRLVGDSAGAAKVQFQKNASIPCVRVFVRVDVAYAA